MNVVAVQRDVELAERDLLAFKFLDPFLEAARQRDAAGAESHQDQVVDPLVALDNFMS